METQDHLLMDIPNAASARTQQLIESLRVIGEEDENFKGVMLSGASKEVGRSISEAATFVEHAREATSIERDPIHPSRAEAITYLQSNLFRKSNPNRTRQLHDKPHGPYGSHIAVVQLPNGKLEVLHATKGWRRGIHV